MIHGEVVGLKNGEIVMGDILEEDCKDRIINNVCIFDTLQHVSDILNCEANQSCKCSV